MPRVRLTEKAIQAAKAEDGARLELWDQMTPGLCLRVTCSDERQRKSWVLRYRAPDGRQPRLKLGDYSTQYGLAEARADARAHQLRIQQGADPSADLRKMKAKARLEPIKTMDNLADFYFELSQSGEWKPKGKPKRARTISDEKDIYARYLKPALGKLRLDDIDRPTVKAAIRKLVARGINARANRAQAVARQMFALAIAEERLQINPATGFQPMGAEAPRVRVLSDAEIKAFWNGLQSPSELQILKEGKDPTPVYVGRPMAILLELALLLLQRRSEIAGMRRGELNLEQGIWLIPAERMKGGQPHCVPLPPRSIALIQDALKIADDQVKQRWRKRRDKGEEGIGEEPSAECVFPSRSHPDVPVGADSPNHAMRQICLAFGIPDATPHDLRRTGSTALTSERLGVAHFIRSKVLGHRGDAGGGSRVSMLHYDVNEYAAEKRRALELWEALVLRISEAPTEAEYLRIVGVSQ